MTTADLASALRDVQARLAGAQLVAEFAHGLDNRDLDRALAVRHPRGVLTFAPATVRRIAALSRTRSGTTIREVGTGVFECAREAGDWLISSQVVTIQRRETAG
jgi:hypothetical protein